MDFTIREMRDSDQEAVLEIYGEGIREGRSTFTRVCPSWTEWDGAHLRDCRLVAEADGRVAGFAALLPTSTRDAYKGVAEVSVYIGGAFHGRGAGTALIATLIPESERLGYWTLYACIFSRNAASRRLFERSGFRYIGFRERVARDRFGVWRDTVMYERRSALIY